MMMLQQEETVSIEGFVAALLETAGTVVGNQDSIGYGYSRGWLQEQDVSERQQPLLKKHCARIVHEFLRREQKEPDELDSGPAGKLQDLFDCRVCAGHIMQVYTKGIMEAYICNQGTLVFGMEDVINRETAECVIQRVLQKEKRNPVITTKKSEARKLSYTDAITLLEKEQCVLVDVRAEADFQESHLKSAVHCPMMEILKNPYRVSERRDASIVLYCEKGYMSETAAQSLAGAGYENVLYFALAEKDAATQGEMK